MTGDITSTSFINKISFDKKENRLLKILTKCKTRKCSKINNQRIEESKIYEKELNQMCPNLLYKCASEFDKKYGSKYKMLFNKFTQCGIKKCSKERKTLKKYQEKLKRAINKNMSE